MEGRRNGESQLSNNESSVSARKYLIDIEEEEDLLAERLAKLKYIERSFPDNMFPTSRYGKEKGNTSNVFLKDVNNQSSILLTENSNSFLCQVILKKIPC